MNRYVVPCRFTCDTPNSLLSVNNNEVSVILSSTMCFSRPINRGRTHKFTLTFNTDTTSHFRQRSCPTPTVTLPHLVHLVFLKAQLTPLPSFVILPGTLPVQFRPLAKLYISGIYGFNSELLAVTPNHFYLSIIILLPL